MLIGGQFTVSGTNILLQGVKIGVKNTDGGEGTRRLAITFNANATRAIVQQLLRSIRFRTVNNDSTVQRVIDFSLTDGDGGTSDLATKRVNVV